MEETNTVSVIVPVYNVKPYIRDCVDSLLQQSVPFDEIILVNDGSTDGSEVICREYQQAHPEIILIEQENLGLSEARNSGMRKAAGDYIIFVDSDDWVSDSACETIKKKTGKNGVDVLFYAADIVKEIPMKVSDQIYARDSEEVNKVMAGFESLKRMFPVYYEMSACMAAYRRHFLEEQKIAFIKDILYEDRFFSLRVITEAKRVLYVEDMLYIRRFRASSIITSPASKRKLLDVLNGHKKEWAYIREREEWRKEQMLTRYFVLCGTVMAFQGDVSGQDMRQERAEYLEAFFGEWLTCFVIEDMTVNELCELLLMVNQAADSRNRELAELFEEVGGIDQYQTRLRKYLLESYSIRLRKLPFGEPRRIGIYGAGAHTDCMLQLYRDMIGPIAAEIYLLVSDAADVREGSEFMMRSLDEIPKDTDAVIISSKVYQEDMYRNLKKRGIPEERIRKLYGKNDAVDCVMIYNALHG